MNPFADYPAPPHEMVMPDAWQLPVTAIFGIAALGMWIYALVIYAREKDLMPLLVMLGGTLCAWAEPMVDVLGMCWWPVHNQRWTTVSYFGHHVPAMCFFAYMLYYGGMVFISIRQMERSVSRVQIWRWFILMVLLESTFEPIPINLGLWAYYGEQPFRVFGFPLWWPPVNAVAALVPAVLILKLRPQLRGFGLLALVPLVITGDIVGNAATAWPVWSALHTSKGLGFTTMAGLATLLLCVAVIQMIAAVVVPSQARVEPAPKPSAA